jgi:hypothetical protein
MTEQQAEPQERVPDRPDMRDPTNGAPLLQGQSSTTGLGGVGNETAGGGVGPDLSGGAAPEEVTARSPWMSNAEARTAGGTGTSGPGTCGPGSNDTDDDDAPMTTTETVGRER